MLLVRGNHDRRAGDPPRELNVHVRRRADRRRAVRLYASPDAPDDGYVLCGHSIPACGSPVAARQSSRLPCFWFSPIPVCCRRSATSPDSSIVDVAPDDRVWVVADDEVIEKRGARVEG